MGVSVLMRCVSPSRNAWASGEAREEGGRLDGARAGRPRRARGRRRRGEARGRLGHAVRGHDRARGVEDLHVGGIDADAHRARVPEGGGHRVVGAVDGDVAVLLDGARFLARGGIGRARAAR